MSNPIEEIKAQLAQLKSLHDAGVLSEPQYMEGKTKLEQRLLDLVLSGATVPAESAASTGATAATGPAAAPAPAPAAGSAAQPAGKTARPSARLVGSLVLLVVALAAGGYFWKGSPSLMPQLKVQTAADANAGGDGAAGQPHAVTQEQISAMVDKLVAHLKEQPNDGEGWAMLARTYGVLQRTDDALKAYEKAMALRKDDAALLADYADALAVSHNSLDGEPMKQIEKALKLDPKNLKALALAGTYAFNKKDYTNAVKLWEKMVQIGPADNVFIKQIQPGIAEARKLAGMPPAPQPLDEVKTPAAAAPVSGASVSGTVTLAPALASQARPDDTVFVFARPADGSRMPLAILRRQVKDLPLKFTLDDSMAMSPSSSLATASKVIVGARISRSGNAIPQAGDMQGSTAVVAVGATGLSVEIKDVVKP